MNGKMTMSDKVAELCRLGWVATEDVEQFRACKVAWMQAEFLADVALRIAKGSESANVFGG